MKENKTQPEKTSVKEFLNSIENEIRRANGLEVFEMMKTLTGAEPVMWGTSIVGFGTFHYKGKSREGDWLTIGLSPRKAALTLYGLIHYDDNRQYLSELGPNTTGAGCIYIKDLSKINKDVLSEMISVSFKEKNGQVIQY